MRYFYRNVECKFTQFLSAYLAVATEHGVPESHQLELVNSLIAQHRANVPLPMTQEQRITITQDTLGQVTVETTFAQFMKGG